MKKVFSFLVQALFIQITLSASAQSFSPDKVYTIVCKPDFNTFMQDKGTGTLLLSSEPGATLWAFEPTGNADCYYVRNVKTGNYIQACQGSEVALTLGTDPMEYYIKGDATGAQAGENFFRLSSTNLTPHDFSAGTIGLNRSGDNTKVQGFASVSGANQWSVWRILEVPRVQESLLESPFTGSEVAEGSVYLYNVESGMWLQNNNRANPELTTNYWTTRAELGNRGLDLELIALSDGGYQINPKYKNNRSVNASNFYLDTQIDVTSWVFTPKAVAGVSNAYTIDCGHVVLGSDVNGYLRGVDLGATTWQVVSREERMRYVEQNASPANPVDVSFLVNNPDFSANNERSAWVVSRSGGIEIWNDVSRYNRHCQVQGSASVDIAQTGIEVPNGTYQVCFTAFYAPVGLGNLNIDAYNAYKSDGDATVFAVGYANGETVKLPSVFSVEGTQSVANVHQKQIGDYFFPGNPDQANGSFARQYYQSELLTVTVTDGILNLGVKSIEGCPASAWIGVSDVKLYYIGSAEKSMEVAVTGAGYATFVAPMEAAVPDGVAAYTVEVNADGVTLDLTPVNPIPANTPVVLEAEEGTYEFVGSEVAPVDAPTFGALTGTYERIPAPHGSYVLQQQGEKVGFFFVDAAEAMPYVNANHAYLTAPAAGVKAFFFGSDATGIEAVGSSQAVAGAVYNLAGQRLSKMQKGVNIVNGKKVLR